ncbi:hypothetical protein AOLI_G00022140 [Acnodon oligacanthus]
MKVYEVKKEKRLKTVLPNDMGEKPNASCSLLLFVDHVENTPACFSLSTPLSDSFPLLQSSFFGGLKVWETPGNAVTWSKPPVVYDEINNGPKRN